MEKEIIGYYKVNEPKTVIVSTGYIKYDRYVTVPVGVYPVYESHTYKDAEGGKFVNYALVWYGEDVHELPYGFMLATDPNFEPCNGWKVKTYTYYSDIMEKDILTGKIYKEGESDNE